MSEPLQISVHVEEKRYQPTQEKTVVPGWDAKTVTPDRGYALSKVTVEGMPEPTETETFTENGEYNVGRIGTAIVDVGIDLQNKTVTPTEQTQTVEADDGYDGLDTVTVNPIPPEYVIPTGSVEIIENGQGIDVAGKATANVNVPQGVFPSGTKVITENVTGEDVTNYAAVDVAVPIPPGYVIPTGSMDITANGQVSVSGKATANVNVGTFGTDAWILMHDDSIYVGENTISNGAELVQYLQAAQQIPGSSLGIYACNKKQEYANNEFLYHENNSPTGSRWRDGAISQFNWGGSGYSVVCPSGTIVHHYVWEVQNGEI